MALYGADYQVFCGSIKRREGEREEISKTISNGPMPTSRAWDFSQCTKPCGSEPTPMRKLSIGEPCAGESLARFGGRGESGRALLYPYSAMDGKLKYIHVVWIPAIPAGMTGFVKLMYNGERSGVRMPPGSLQRHATLERCRMSSHAKTLELYAMGGYFLRIP